MNKPYEKPYGPKTLDRIFFWMAVFFIPYYLIAFVAYGLTFWVIVGLVLWPLNLWLFGWLGTPIHRGVVEDWKYQRDHS